MDNSSTTDQPDDRQIQQLDLRGIECPQTFVRAKWKLEQLNPGEILEVLVDHEPAHKRMPKNMKNHGQKIRSIDRHAEHEWKIQIIRTEQAPPTRWVQVH